MIADSSHLALTPLKQAEAIMDSLNMNEVKEYVYNGLANTYSALENYDLAEYYVLQCIEIDSENVASYYLLLVSMVSELNGLNQRSYRYFPHLQMHVYNF